jgi:16S rRNA processing protein RimM
MAPATHPLSSLENDNPPARLRVGRVIGAHGLHGALRVRPDNPDSDTLEHLKRVFVGAEDGTAGEYRLIEARRLNPTTLRLKCEGLDDPDAAQALRGSVVSVAIEDLPPRSPGEFYYYEAIGCVVATTGGRRLGVIAEVFATGANDVWVVRDGQTEVLVPVIDSVVKSIDLKARMMVIEAVPGLLD